jgi:hypothetical protein
MTGIEDVDAGEESKVQRESVNPPARPGSADAGATHARDAVPVA